MMIDKLLLISAFFTSVAAPVHAADNLLSAEEAVKNGAPLSSYRHLAAHPLYPYLQFREYRSQLDTLPPQTVAEFLQKHPRAPFSGWLAEHAYPKWLAGGNYRAILDSYAPSFADESIECEWRLALLATGERARAQAGLEDLWLSAKAIEPACDPLFAQFPPTQAQIAERFMLVMKDGDLSLANYLRPLLQGAAGSAADSWIAARQGRLPLQSLLNIGDARWRAAALGDLFYRSKRDQLQSVAPVALQAVQSGLLNGDPAAAGRGLSRIAARLAQEDDPRSEIIFSGIAPGHHDKNAVFDLIAYYQRSNRWQALPALLGRLGADDLKQAEIQYWIGKSYEKTGQSAQAQSHYQNAARERDFFGFLAAEKLGQAPQFKDRPLTRDAHYAAVAAQPAAYRMKIFLRRGDFTRAQQEYNGLTYKMNDAELRQAALLAAENGWVIQSVVSLVKTKDWDALNIRFPLQYEDRVRRLASQNNISEAAIFAIIRKESIFQPQIKSSAGAVGLMQVMPATAAAVARNSGIPYSGAHDLINPDINLQIGSRYLADRLRQYGHLAYAAAAYNAGPSRADRWLAERPHLPLDEWIAQIPFYETRDYVKRVMEFERVYEYRLGLPHAAYRSHPTVKPW